MGMDSPISISVVCPCYNSLKYLSPAVESFIHQDYKGSSELIFVVDPSSDGTMAFLSSLTDPRIRVIANKARLGLFASRSLGIKEAKGKYVGFLDADDYLEPSFLRKMVEALEVHDADMADCSFYTLNDEKDEKRYPLRGHSKVIGKYKAAKMLLSDTHMRGFLWSKVYKKEKLVAKPSLSLPSGHMFEDMPMNFAAIAKLSRIVFLKEPLYHYRKSKGDTLTNVKRSDRAAQHLESFALMRIFADRSGDPKLIKIVRHRVWRMKLSLRYDVALSKEAGLKKKEARQILRKLRLLKRRKPLPIEGEPWEEIAKGAF